MPITAMKSLSTPRWLMRFERVEPARPPLIPPAIIRDRTRGSKGGIFPLAAVKIRLVIWEKKMMNRELRAAVLLSMEKKK